MINEVRNTVLTILNKNNYGYLSPSDFNLLATNAQMEIYQEYYSSYNKTINGENSRISGTDYADIGRQITETMESFLMSDFIVPKFSASGNLTNNFYVPSETTVGNNLYMLSKVLVYTKKVTNGTNTTKTAFKLIDSTANFTTLGVNIGDIVVNSSTYKSTIVQAVATNTLDLQDDIFVNVSVGEKYIIYSGTSYSEAEKVMNSKILMLQNSLLTAPSTIYPAYSITGSLMSFYPTSIQGYGAVKADYFRHPYPPKWTYVTLTGGEPVFDQSQPDFQDFELPPSDEFKLVTKMLEYCGIVIREISVSQFGSAEQSKEQPSFSVQQ